MILWSKDNRNGVRLLPYLPKKPCRHPGCPALIEHNEKYCSKHKSLHNTQDRPSAHSRGYTSRWRKASKQFLLEHPLCAECMRKTGRPVPATVVDHIKPHRGDQTLFWDMNNWQPLCKRCHDRKTATEDGGFGRGRTY